MSAKKILTLDLSPAFVDMAIQTEIIFAQAKDLSEVKAGTRLMFLCHMVAEYNKQAKANPKAKRLHIRKAMDEGLIAAGLTIMTPNGKDYLPFMKRTNRASNHAKVTNITKDATTPEDVRDALIAKGLKSATQVDTFIAENARPLTDTEKTAVDAIMVNLASTMIEHTTEQKDATLRSVENLVRQTSDKKIVKPKADNADKAELSAAMGTNNFGKAQAS